MLSYYALCAVLFVCVQNCNQFRSCSNFKLCDRCICFFHKPIAHRLVPTFRQSRKKQNRPQILFLNHSLNCQVKMGNNSLQTKSQIINQLHNCCVEFPFHVALSSLLSPALASPRRRMLLPVVRRRTPLYTDYNCKVKTVQ